MKIIAVLLILSGMLYASYYHSSISKEVKINGHLYIENERGGIIHSPNCEDYR